MLADQDKQKIRQLIDNKLVEYQSQLALAKESSKTVELDQALAGRVSRIDAIQQQKIAQAGLDRVKLKIKQLKLTLELLGSEEFGDCEECGKPIGIGRLTIKPESKLCIDCQSLLE